MNAEPPPPSLQMRLARPVRDLSRAVSMYGHGLGLKVLASFEDHAGFDGVVLGRPGLGYHFEFTHFARHPLPPTPTLEDLVVFYLPDTTEWQRISESMQEAGFVRATSFNPYWDERGVTFEDPDGYRIVLYNAAWAPPA